MQSPTTMRSPGDEARPPGSRGCDSEPGDLERGAPALPPPPLRAACGRGGSTWTAVGAELFEPPGGAGWVGEPPGFIAAESSRARVPVERKCARICPAVSVQSIEHAGARQAGAK